MVTTIQYLPKINIEREPRILKYSIFGSHFLIGNFDFRHLPFHATECNKCNKPCFYERLFLKKISQTKQLPSLQKGYQRLPSPELSKYLKDRLFPFWKGFHISQIMCLKPFVRAEDLKTLGLQNATIFHRRFEVESYGRL